MRYGNWQDREAEHRLANYRLTTAAEDDLVAIALFGDERFGVEQSDRYRDQLKQRFEALADNPEHYPLVKHIRPGYRRSVVGGHSIYYRFESEGIVIVRVLGRQSLATAFKNLPDWEV